MVVQSERDEDQVIFLVCGTRARARSGIPRPVETGLVSSARGKCHAKIAEVIVAKSSYRESAIAPPPKPGQVVCKN